MSVTFSIDGNPTGEFSALCYENDVTYTARDLGRIQDKIAIHKTGCEECRHYGMFPQAMMDVDDALDVNLANTNARMVLAILGVGVDAGEDLCGRVAAGEDLCGRVAAADLLGRVMVATIGLDDSGVAPANLFPSQPGATMIDCGLRPGYFAETFGRLADLATEAERLGREIVFG